MSDWKQHHGKKERKAYYPLAKERRWLEALKHLGGEATDDEIDCLTEAGHQTTSAIGAKFRKWSITILTGAVRPTVRRSTAKAQRLNTEEVEIVAPVSKPDEYYIRWLGRGSAPWYNEPVSRYTALKRRVRAAVKLIDEGNPAHAKSMLLTGKTP